MLTVHGIDKKNSANKIIIILIVQHRFQFIYLPSGDATSCIVFCIFICSNAQAVDSVVV